MRKSFRAMRFVLVLVVALVGVLAVTGSASGKGHGTKHKKCKAGKIAVTVNGRAKCTPLRKALPKPKAADQNLVAVQQALGMNLKGLTRHRKKVPSARKLLGANGVKKLEGAVRKGLAIAARLKTAKAPTLSSVASPFATASGGGCGGPAEAKALNQKFQGNGFSGGVDFVNGTTQMAVDGGSNGVRVELDLSLCEKGGLSLPSCPDAEGRLEGTDTNQVGLSLKVFQGGELVLGQGFSSKATTKIQPVQVGDDAKLQFFEIDHTYNQSGSLNGVSVHFTYHGHARVTFPGGSYDPTNTDVDAKVSVAGVDHGDEEVSEAEFDLGYAAKPKADQIFAAEVDKVIKALESTERNWMTPNACAKINFTPERNSLKPLKKDATGTFEARVDASKGGAPDSGTWSVLKQANGSFTPTTAHANPATFNYTVKKVGTEVFIEVNLKVVSAAGVAEKDWIQPTEPDEINHMTGSFEVKEHLGGSNTEWFGEATYDRITPGLGGPMGVYKFASGSVTGVFSGESGDGGGCDWTGQHKFSIGENGGMTVVEVNPASLEPPYEYLIDATVRNQTPTGVTHTNCSESKYNGTAVEIQPDMDFFTDFQVSDDAIHFKGSTFESPGPGYTIEQTWDFEGVK